MNFRRIAIEPVSGNLGAIIKGVDLATLDDETFTEIHQAWLKYSVIFFREQKLRPLQQIDFAKRFGEIHFHPYMRGLDDHPEILEIIKESLSKSSEEIFSITENLSVPLREARENFEKEYLTTQIKKFGGNISKTAKFVGMERSALHRKLKLLGVKDLN